MTSPKAPNRCMDYCKGIDYQQVFFGKKQYDFIDNNQLGYIIIINVYFIFWLIMNSFSNNLFLKFLICGIFISPISFGTIYSSEFGEEIVKAKELIQGRKTFETTVVTDKKWKSFKFKNEGFSVEFPKDPAHSKQTIEIPQSDLTITYDTYVSELNEDAVYVISVWEYPKQVDMSKPEINLQEGFSGMLSALPESQVLLMRSKENQGFKALEFWVKNEDIFFKGELISADNKLYQIFVVYKGDGEMETVGYGKFISSFKLHKNASKTPKSSGKKVFYKSS